MSPILCRHIMII